MAVAPGLRALSAVGGRTLEIFNEGMGAQLTKKHEGQPATTPERSRLMKRVRQEDTAPEQDVRVILRELGIAYRKNVRGLPGSPDIAHKGRRKALFVNGCYWHKHSVCGRGKVPKTNAEFWGPKLKQNRLRDQKKIDALRAEGFDVLVVWECELADSEFLKERLSILGEVRGWMNGGSSHPAASRHYGRPSGRRGPPE